MICLYIANDKRRPPVPAHVALALYLLYEQKDADSSLRAYLESLPKSFDTIPLLWTQDLVDLLPASTQAYLAKQRTVFSKHLASAIRFLNDCPILSSRLGNTLDVDSFTWSWLAVNSRCIYQELSPTSTRDDNYACSPLIDMINHAPSTSPHCKLSYDIKGLSVISTSSYQAGQETFISYGAHSNDALLCEYGFVMSCNPDNHVVIDTLLLKKLGASQQRLLMEMGYFEEYTINHDGNASFRTEVAVRVALLGEDECVEGSRGCRRLMQFVNGQSSGSREQAEVDAFLRKLLEEDLVACQVKLDGLNSAGQYASLIKQLWFDRVDIIRAALYNIRS